MKKSIMFMIINLNVGGVEKALLNMLDEMSPEKYKVKILILEKYGDFLTSIPKWVEVDCVEYYEEIKEIINQPPRRVILHLLKKKKLLEAFSLTGITLLCKILKSRELFYRNILKKYPDYYEEFDIAVAYAGPMALIDYYIINKVRAKEKIGWIHFDITTIGIEKKMIESLYKKFKKINIVSRDGKNKFDEIFPKLRNKTEVSYNVVPERKIRKMSGEEGFKDDFEGKRILTVGRISKEKGQDLAIEALKMLIEDQLDVKWYFVGDGDFRKQCEEKAKELGIGDRAVFLGTKSNPYPYMRECNIYVQPSRYEGFCITLAEIKIFNKPIIATDFTGAREQLHRMENAFICKMGAASLYEQIKKQV